MYIICKWNVPKKKKKIGNVIRTQVGNIIQHTQGVFNACVAAPRGTVSYYKVNRICSVENINWTKIVFFYFTLIAHLFVLKLNRMLISYYMFIPTSKKVTLNNKIWLSYYYRYSIGSSVVFDIKIAEEFKRWKPWYIPFIFPINLCNVHNKIWIFDFSNLCNWGNLVSKLQVNIIF